MKQGVIKFYNAQKGFGFIEVEEDEYDTFIHASEVGEEVELNEGDRVEFETKPSNKEGQREIACNLKVVN